MSSEPIDPERKHAIEVRFLGRMHWSLLGVALIVGWGVPHGWPRALFLAGLAALAIGLNVPAYRVIQRAVREAAPAHLVRALWVPLVLRALAAAGVIAMLAQ
ncbi:MAG: hypothetical protein U0353_23540 [Sandaracinus sp.]